MRRSIVWGLGVVFLFCAGAASAQAPPAPAPAGPSAGSGAGSDATTGAAAAGSADTNTGNPVTSPDSSPGHPSSSPSALPHSDTSLPVPTDSSDAERPSRVGATSPYDASRAHPRGVLDRDPMVTLTPIDSISEEDCGAWTQVAVHSDTVSVVRLEVPGKARGIYQHACGDLRKKKFDEAQRDAQRAIGEHHDFPAAWVLLGQAYFKTDQIERAHEACSEAQNIDPDYAASYLCLSAVAENREDWDLLAGLADQAVSLAPLRDPYAFYYRAEAAFHNSDFKAAEKDATSAAEADRSHQLPEIQLLLARIFSAKNDVQSAQDEIRSYLKITHAPSDSAAVDARLASLLEPAK